MKLFSLPANLSKNLIPACQLLVKAAWAALFFTLPLTSFPYFPSGLGGKTLVRPLATYPLIFLLLLITLPRFFKRPLPRTFLPLLVFLLIAGLSSLLSLAADIEALRGVTPLDRFIRSLATLALGAAFYFTIALLPETWQDLRFSLRWLIAGFSLALAWGSLQVLYVLHYSPPYFKLLNQLQSLISSRKLFATRISGMTYEPKWFAEQLCLLVLPWLLGAILSKQSIFSKAGWLSLPMGLSAPHWLTARIPATLKRNPFEWLLLAWTGVVLLFTFSRTGLVILGVLLVLAFLIYRLLGAAHSTASEAQPTLASGKQQSLPPVPITQSANYPHNKPQKHKPLPKTRIMLEVAAIMCGLIFVFVLVGSQNPYFSRFWRYFTEAKQRNRTYLEYIAFDQRFTYWQTAFNMFEAYPVLGVGLGNYAFYFDEMLPDRLYRQAEIIRQTTPTEGRDRLITPKNLPARLLAETGILGTAVFAAFLISLTGCILFLWFQAQHHKKLYHPSPELMWAASGALALIASLFVMFSMDSFARPEIWVAFGLLTAAAHLPHTAPSTETVLSTVQVSQNG